MCSCLCQAQPGSQSGSRCRLHPSGPSKSGLPQVLNPVSQRPRPEAVRRCWQGCAIPVNNHLLEQTSLAWGLQEIQFRLPCTGVEFLSAAEVDAVCAMAVAPHADGANAVPHVAELIAVAEQEAKAVLKSRLEAPSCSRILAIVHSEGPSNFTLLERIRSADGQYVLRYYDSLKPHSASGRAKAQTFVDQCEWGLQVPEPVNRRFQCDGWSCGLWRLQFAEEAMWSQSKSCSIA